MAEIADNRILRITRLLVYLIMGLVALGGTVLVIVSAVGPFYWADAVAILAKEKPSIDHSNLLPLLLAIFAMGIFVIGLLWTMMRKLIQIIDSVEQGNPFILANAVRLKSIGWMMIALQVVGVPLALTAGKVADMFGESDTGYEFSFNGVLAILLVFILAGIFERGAEMREELEGTI